MRARRLPKALLPRASGGLAQPTTSRWRSCWPEFELERCVVLAAASAGSGGACRRRLLASPLSFLPPSCPWLGLLTLHSQLSCSNFVMEQS
jgi:hypothetical protein